MTRHGLSFDVEDWHQLTTRRVTGAMPEPSLDVDDCVARILDLCDGLDVKATFFVVGLLAKSRPHIVRAIAARGHEVASLSFRHELVYTQSTAEFARDIRDSKAQLEDLAGAEVVGYRAPEFSVQRLDHPCFAALREAGFRYDSSVFPVAGLRYGIAAPHTPFEIATPAGTIVELPLATAPLANRRIPIAGGSGFRFMPSSLLTWAASEADARGESLVFYFHPYEFTRRWLYLSGGLVPNRKVVKHVLLHNFRTRHIEQLLRHVVPRLDFAPLREIAQETAA